MFNRKERRDAAERRQQILQHARQLFTEQGVDNVSMHQIAKSAGVGQGTLYRRYSHKGDLCMDIMKESFRRLLEDIDKHLLHDKNCTMREKLEGVLRIWFEFVVEQSQFLIAIQSPACAERRSTIYRSSIYQSIHSIIRDLLAEAGLENSKQHLDPVFTADAILAMMCPDLYLLLCSDRGYSSEDVWRNIQNLYVAPWF